MMPKVILILPEGTRSSKSEHDFEVAPVVGSIIELRIEGGTQFFRVEETWHSEGTTGRVRYFAALAKEEASDRWTTADAYLEIVPEVDALPPADALEA